MKKKSYQTKGRRELIDFLSQNPDRQFTVEELCTAVNGDSEQGKSSIYRHLTRLCADSAVRKFQSEDRARSVYQYVGEGCDCGRHFHVKCSRCGALQHLECKDSAEFAGHVLREHGFSIDCGGSILYGICAACEGREKKA